MTKFAGKKSALMKTAMLKPLRTSAKSLHICEKNVKSNWFPSLWVNAKPYSPIANIPNGLTWTILAAKVKKNLSEKCSTTCPA